MERVDLHELTIDRDGPKATLRFDLDDRTLRMPEKWIQREYNCIQVCITCFGIREFRLEGFTTENLVSISFCEDSSGGIAVRVLSETVCLDLSCGNVFIDEISAYAKAD